MVMYDVARPSLVSLAFGWVGDQPGNITLSHVRDDIHTLYLTYIHSCIYTYIHTYNRHTSFINLFIYRGYFYSTSSSPLLLRGIPTQHGYCAGVSRRSAAGNCPRFLRSGLSGIRTRDPWDERCRIYQ